MTTNRQFKLASRPTGLPTRDNWSYVESEAPTPQDGEMLLETQYISLDPAMRGWMNAGRSYIEPVGIGDVMRAGTVSKVLESKNADFAVGDFVVGTQGVQTHAVSDGKGLRKVDAKLAPLPLYLGTLGMPGMTAYFGLLDVGQVKEGDTVVVSGAAGAVGIPTCQIAKIKGARVVGIAGGEAKCKYLLDEIGVDVAIDYKSEDVSAKLKEHCPKRIDVYFDNVGGDILDCALSRLNMKARVVLCGAISQYNNTDGFVGPKNYMALLVARARMEGFVVFDYAAQYGEAAKEMAGWMAAGKLKSKEHIVEGFDTFPETFLMLFSGKNLGKLVLKVVGD